MKTTLLILLSLCCLSPCAYAAPSVTNVSDLTISGSSFGTKSPAKPYLWAPFDTSSSPSSLGIVSAWDGITNMEWNSTEGINGTGCLKATDNSGTWTANINATDFSWNAYNQKCYVFRKLKRNFDPFNYDGQGSHLNWKMWRVWAAGLTYPDSYYSSETAYTEGVTWPNGTPYGSGQLMVGQSGEYYTNEFWYQNNSENSNTTEDIGDGTLEIWNNGVRAFYVPYDAYGDGTWRYWKMRETESADMVVFYAIHGVKANATLDSSYRYWADDVYVDTTWARVMVGNASTLASSTHREIQIPTTWITTSISVVWNQGTFEDYETVYLFVVDSDGNVSDGYEGFFLDGVFYSGCYGCSINISGSLTITNITME